MLRRQALWLRLGALLLKHYGIQRHHSQMLRRDDSVYWRQDQRWKLSHWKKTKIWVPWWSFNKLFFLSRYFWTIAALNRGFLERLRIFPSIYLIIVNTVETKIFYFCAVTFWYGPFLNTFLKAFLMASWFITWGLPNRRSFRNSEAFKFCST